MKFGWIPDVPDRRDMYLSFAYTEAPQKVDLRKGCPPVYNQGNLGSCTAQAVAAMVQYQEIKTKKPSAKDIPSRLFIYYNERALMGTIYHDSGAYLRDGIKVISKQGYCEEYHWVYDVKQYTKKPPKEAYDDAKKSVVDYYARVPQTLTQLKNCLALGKPFVFGFSVYDSFMKVGINGKVPMPRGNEKMQGGHAVLAVGYDDSINSFIIRNSWGPRWGDKGYCYMPYSYLTDGDLAADFWTIQFA